MNAQKLCNKNGYRGKELLMNTVTGSIDTAKNWAEDFLKGIWCEEHEEEHFCQSMGNQFSSLVEVQKDQI
jgi:hypothetical protein